MWKRTFEQIMEIWITPEVIRRQEAGLISRPYDLKAGQIILHADGRPNEVRLNDEVRALGKVKLKDGLNKSKGDPVYAHEIENYESFRLPDDEDPNCGHITIIRFGDQWSLAFDAIYNKGIAAKHLSAARQFIAAAQQALESNSLRVFVDTCFSAAELTAKAILLTSPIPGESHKMTHGRIHARYNLQAKFGNVDASHKDALNRLATLRGSARYLNNELHITDDDARVLIKAVEDAISFGEKRVQIERSITDKY
jgi:uncharacterized protein (UPF0332 family)